jgi:hypothetical protein
MSQQQLFRPEQAQEAPSALLPPLPKAPKNKAPSPDEITKAKQQEEHESAMRDLMEEVEKLDTNVKYKPSQESCSCF